MINQQLGLENEQKIRLKFSPYTYARVKVMKAKLLRKDDYHRLLKMSDNEVLRFIQDTDYRQEIDEYNVLTEGMRVIESALNANLMKVVQKLFRISDQKMQQFISIYLLRYDMENFKIILRSKFAKLDLAEIQPLLFSSINYNSDFLKNLLNKESIDEIIKQLPFLKKEKIDTTELFAIENALDKYYVLKLNQFSANLKGQGKIVAQFLKQETEMINIKLILRLKEENKSVSEIEPFLLNPSLLVQTLLRKESTEQVVKELHKHKITELKGEEEDLMEKLEMDLSIYLLKKESLLMHQHMLSANFILGYLFAKEIEVKNLKTLLKGKKLGLDDSYIEKLLVFGK